MNYHPINRVASCFKERLLDSPEALNQDVPARILSIPNSVGFTCTDIEWYSLQDLTGNNVIYGLM